MKSVKAVVFDADGTLFNSFELIVAAYGHVAQTHGLRPPTAQEVRAQLGQTIPDILRALFPESTNIDELVQTNSSYYVSNISTTVAFAGLHDLLEDVYQAGLKMAILTGTGSSVRSLLRHHGVEAYFSSIVTHERIIKPKPDPEGFILASRECGATPYESIMVGDQVEDILAGKYGHAAATIALTHGYGETDGLTAAGADFIAADLPEAGRVIAELSK